MNEPDNPTPPRPKRTRWRFVLRAILLTLLAAVALLVVFFRPLALALIHEGAIRLAARSRIHLSFKVEGDALSGLTFQEIRATPDGASPVELISVARLRIHYDLFHLLSRGVRDFVTGYDVNDARIIVTPVPGQENPLMAILEQPALYSDHVKLDNLNVTLKTPKGIVALQGIDLLLDPVKPGYFRAKELAVPNLGAWRNVSTKITYLNRHLVAGDFQLGPELRVKRLEFDASRRERGISYLSLEGSVRDGEAGLFIWRKVENKTTSEAQINAYVKDLPLAAVRDFSGSKGEVSGSVAKAWVRLAGNPEIPSQWHGDSGIEMHEASVGGIQIGSAKAFLTVAKGWANLTDAEIVTGRNRFGFTATRQLPDTVAAMLTADAEGTLSFDAPELSTIAPAIFSGTAHGEGHFKAKDKSLSISLQGALASLSGTAGGVPFSVEKGDSNLALSYNLAHLADAKSPWFDTLKANTDAILVSLRIGNYALDSGTLGARLENGVATLDSAEFRRGSNTIKFDGLYRLPLEPGAAAQTAAASSGAKLHFSVDAPVLSAFNAPVPAAQPDAAPLDGSLAASGELRQSGTATSGQMHIAASSLVYRQFSARRLVADIPLENHIASVTGFELDFDDKNKLAGHGSIELQEPYRYDANLAGTVNDLAVFQPLIGTPLAGALQIDWHGAGDWQGLHHSGEGQLAVRKGRYADFTGIDGDIAGKYSPETVELSVFRVRSDQGAIQAAVHLRDERLRLDQLQIEVGKTAKLTGSLAFPLDLRTPAKPETLIPESGALAASLTLVQLDLAKVFPEPPPPPPVKEYRGHLVRDALPVNGGTAAALTKAFALRGKVDGSLVAEGTIQSPDLRLDLQASGLQYSSAQNLPKCAANARVTFKGDWLALNGVLTTPGVAPLQLSGSIPFPLRSVLKEGKIDPSTPVAASLKLAPTSAAFIPPLAPALRYAEGRLSVDAAARGTLGDPMLSGGLAFDLTALRFQNANVPAIGNLHGDLQFSNGEGRGNELTVRRLQGDIAGGPFAVTGRVRFDSLADPQIDFRIRSAGTLLARNDALTLRADTDLRIAGPLSAAQVTGKVGVTKSRFFKEIDILPLGIPGQASANKPKAAVNPSIDLPPFRNWSFDVALKTTEPFAVRSNLVNGYAYIDLRLAGTGLSPTLDGNVRLENFVASLPFSRLDIDRGYLYFSANDSFNPTLDIHGSSRIRDYYINSYIYGSLSSPQTVFTSEPPLAQEDVIALLATGATSQEITQNDQVLATRAGVLLLQNLYQRVFKPKSPKINAKPNEPLERFRLDVGTVDPRTGRQELGGAYKITNQYEVGAGLDVEGDVKLEIRYLLRFR